MPRAGSSTCRTAPAPSATWPTCWRARRSCSAARVDDDARYFYELAIRHEDMHVEALTYSRQTLVLCAAARAGRCAGVRRRAPCRAMPTCRAGRGGWARPPPTASSSTTRNGRTRRRWRPSASPARRSPTPSSRPSSTPAATARREFWSDAGWAWRQRRNAERPVYWQPKRDGVWTARRYRALEELAPHAAGRVRQLVRGRGVVPLGRPAPAERSRMGGRRHRRADARRRAIGRCAPALAVGRCRADVRAAPISTLPSTGRSMSRPAPTATAPSAAGR